MKPSAAMERNREAIRAAVSRYRTDPRVFGSAPHREDHEGSDIDILVDALPDATLFDLGGPQTDLEKLLGVPVDLLPPAELPLLFRASVLSEAAPI